MVAIHESDVPAQPSADHKTDPVRTSAIEAFRMGKLDNAIVGFADIVRRYPHVADAHFNLGLALSATKRFHDAAAAFRYALRLDPDDHSVVKNLAKVMLELGDTSSARDLLLSGTEKHPDDWEACHGLAVLEDLNGRPHESTLWYERLRTLRPDHADAWKADAPVCNVCGERGNFRNPNPDNVRESLWCNRCNSLNRDRFMIFALSLILHEHGPLRTWSDHKEKRVLEADGHRGHPQFLDAHFDYFNTHFAQDVLKQRLDLEKFADLQELQFPDRSFDIVITCDVFEHVRLHRQALLQVFRVLKPGGCLILQIPFNPNAEHTVVRVQPDGQHDVPLLPIQYHGDNSLVYRDYGRDFLEELSDLGFHVHYIEGSLPAVNVTQQNIIICERPGAEGPSVYKVDPSVGEVTVTTRPSRMALIDRYLEEMASDSENDLSNTGLAYDQSRRHYYFELGHADRIKETLKRAHRYLSGCGRALDLGSTGDIPMLLEKVYGVTEVVANGLSDVTVSLKTPNVFGSDPMKHQIHIQGWNAEEDSFPLDSGTFDAVTCFEVLEHLRSDPLFMVREANRVLKDGGYLILTTPNINSYAGVLRTLAQESPLLFSTFESGGKGIIHAKEYALNELRSLLEHGGFRLVDLQTFDAYWYEQPTDSVHQSLRSVLAGFGLTPSLTGQVSFIVGQKTGRPKSISYSPLYTEHCPVSPFQGDEDGPSVIENVLSQIDDELKLEHFAQAEKILQEALTEDPLNPNLQFRLAQVMQGQARTHDAQRILRNILVLYPLNTQALILLGTISIAQGNKDEGLGLLSRAHEDSPGDTQAVVAFAESLVNAGIPAKAVHLLFAHLLNVPDAVDALRLMGSIQLRFGNEAYAEEYFQCVRRLASERNDKLLSLVSRTNPEGTSGKIDAELSALLDDSRIPNKALLHKEFHDNKTVVASLPDFVIIDPTSICNATCITCFHSFETLPWQDLPLECFEKVKHLTSTASQINLFGSGEPFAARNFAYELAEVKRLRRPGTTISISTNGKDLREQCIALLLDKDITIQFSIDAGSRELFNHIRRGIDFDKFVEHLQSLRRMKGDRPYPRITFSTTVSKRNLHELPLIFALAKENGVEHIGLYNEYPLHPSERPYLLDQSDVAAFDGIRTDCERFNVPYGNFLTMLEGTPVQESFPWQESHDSATMK